MRRHLLIAALALAGCGGDPTPATDTTTYEASTAPDGKPVPLGCENSIPSTSTDVPERLLAPPGARVIVESALPRTDDPRITVVEGYVELAPTKLLAGMRDIPGVQVSFTEDEEIEAEILLGTKRARNFWKIVRTCEVASRFTALVVDARDSAAVSGAVRTQTKTGRSR